MTILEEKAIEESRRMKDGTEKWPEWGIEIAAFGSRQDWFREREYSRPRSALSTHTSGRAGESYFFRL